MTRDVEELQRDGSPLDDATLRRVLTNFQALDKDGDGHLTPGEFREGLGMLGMDEGFCRLVFDTFDTQGDGRIDREQLKNTLMDPKSLRLSDAQVAACTRHGNALLRPEVPIDTCNTVNNS